MLGASSCCRVFQELGVGDRGFSELGQESLETLKVGLDGATA